VIVFFAGRVVASWNSDEPLEHALEAIKVEEAESRSRGRGCRDR